MSPIRKRLRAPRAGLFAAALVCMACTPEPGDPLPFARASFHDDCAPWDGAALTLVFADETLERPFEERYPSLRVTSYRPPPVLAGGSFEWEGEARDLGYATWCEAAGSCRAPTAVRVRFDGAQPSDDVLVGEIRVRLEPGRVVEGTFEAVRVPFRALCG